VKKILIFGLSYHRCVQVRGTCKKGGVACWSDGGKRDLLRPRPLGRGEGREQGGGGEKEKEEGEE